MRVEGVALEHHRDVALLRRHARDVAPAYLNAAPVRPIQARDKPERRGFTAPRRAHEDEQLSLGDVQRELGQGSHLTAEAAREPAEHDGGHFCQRLILGGYP
jgi:hypothetical protein